MRDSSGSSSSRRTNRVRARASGRSRRSSGPARRRAGGRGGPSRRRGRKGGLRFRATSPDPPRPPGRRASTSRGSSGPAPKRRGRTRRAAAPCKDDDAGPAVRVAQVGQLEIERPPALRRGIAHPAGQDASQVQRRRFAVLGGRPDAGEQSQPEAHQQQRPGRRSGGSPSDGVKHRVSGIHAPAEGLMEGAVRSGLPHDRLTLPHKQATRKHLLDAIASQFDLAAPKKPWAASQTETRLTHTSCVLATALPGRSDKRRVSVRKPTTFSGTSAAASAR